MKKIILLLTLVLTAQLAAKAQQDNISTTANTYPLQLNTSAGVNESFLKPGYGGDPIKDYAYYNRQSRNMRITGLSLLGAGLASGVAGLLVATGDNSYDSYEAVERKDRTTATLLVVSVVTGLASIPFMIIAHAKKNESRATLSNQKTFIPGKGNTHITGITVSVPLGK